MRSYATYLLLLNMRTLILALALCYPAWLFSQHNHFLYIQSDNQQLFYMKRSGEVLSSSSTGFIILSKLQPGTQSFIIGFPRDQFPEYEFQMELRGRDRGFTLKNMEEKGWVLVDMQSQEVITGRRIEKQNQQSDEKPRTYGSLSDDLFAVTLASVVNDPGIRETSLVQTASMVSAPPAKPAEKPVAMQPQKPAGTMVAPQPKPQPQPAVAKAQPKQSEPKPQPPAAKAGSTDPLPAVVKNTETPRPAEKYAPKPIEKISELKTWSGYQITYIDHSGGRPDTIVVIIDDAAPASGNGKIFPHPERRPKPHFPGGDMTLRSWSLIPERWPDISLS